MRIFRLAKYYMQFIKLASRIILILLKKCYVYCIVSFILIISVYALFGITLAIITWIFTSIYLTYKSCDWLVYHSNDPPDSRTNILSPSVFKLPFESLMVKTSDGVHINLVFIKQEPEKKFNTVPNVIYLHGNAGNVGHRLQNVYEIYREIGCNILMVEYRGYGYSHGSPSERGLYADAEAALNYLLQYPNINHKSIFVFGRSLGGAIAIDLAHNSKFSQYLKGIIVENTFTSIPEIAKVLFNFNFIYYIPTFFYKNHYNSAVKINSVTLPTLFISGLSDELIPPSMMQTLYMLSAGVHKQIHTFEMGNHNFTWRCKNYYSVINDFINHILLSNDNNCPSSFHHHHPHLQRSHVLSHTCEKTIEII